MNRKKYTMTFGGALQETYLTGNLKIQDVDINRSFRNFLPVARFNYDFSVIDICVSTMRPRFRNLPYNNYNLSWTTVIP